MTTTMYKREQVFATPELLEAILVQLPLHDLLFAQRICRQFQEVIANSPRLQQSLFFRPGPSASFSECDSADRKYVELNPLLRMHFQPWFTVPNDDDVPMPKYERIEKLTIFEEESRREACLRKEASWRKMFPVQPPGKSLSVIKVDHDMGGTWVGDASVSVKDSLVGGLTMGIIYDLTESFLRPEPVASFCLWIPESEPVPKVQLYLQMTSQCTGSCEIRKWDLRSKGSEISERNLQYEARKNMGRDAFGWPWEPEDADERKREKERRLTRFFARIMADWNNNSARAS